MWSILHKKVAKKPKENLEVLLKDTGGTRSCFDLNLSKVGGEIFRASKRLHAVTDLISRGLTEGETSKRGKVLTLS